MTHLANRSTAAQINPEKGFRVHLLVFVITVPVLWLVWYFTGSGYPWPIWSTPAWAIGLGFHYLGVFVFKKEKTVNHLK